MTYKKNILTWISIYVLMHLFFLISGQLEGSPAFEYYGNVYFIEPIMYTILIIPAFRYVDLYLIKKLFVRLLLAIDIYILGAILLFRLGLRIDFLTSLPTGLMVNTYNALTHTFDGFLSVKSNNIVAVMFLGPFVTTFLFNNTEKDRRLIIVSTILTVIMSFIYGRRALIAVIIICAFLAIILKGRYVSENSIKVNRVIKYLSFLILIIFVVGIFMRAYGHDLRIGNLSSDLMLLGDTMRSSQILPLFRGWMKHPILGAGYAINAKGSVRSDVPGMYEYTYFARLFQTGVVGSLIYAILMLWIVWKLLKLIRNDQQNADISLKFFLLATVVGFVGYMLSNGTNPILDNFDGCFYLFFPLGLINALELNYKSNKDIIEYERNIYSRKLSRYI